MLYAYLANHLTDERKALFEEVVKQRTRHITVILEDLFQPHNASAVMRSCDCFGVQDIHIIENRNKFAPNKEIAMGSSKWVTLHQYNNEENNTVSCINSLKEKGYKIIATTPHTNDCNIEDLDLSQPIALMFGSEKPGLTPLAMEHADAFAKIPMFGFTESFNISVSAALCLHSATTRMRKDQTIQWQLSSQEQTLLKTEWAKKTLKSSKQLIHRFEEEYLAGLK